MPLPFAYIEVDSHLMMRDLILAGFGVGLLPKGLCSDAIQRGQAMPVLEDFIHECSRLTLTFPTRADIVPRVREFANVLCRSYSAQ
jgi:DNA-binding transcriptional LysR family regulator